MKKVIAAAAFVFAVGFAQAQQTDSTKAATPTETTQAPTGETQYEYYPDANVYYNDAAKKYWYYDSTSTQWKNAEELPSGATIKDKTKKSTFYYNGNNVWEKNAEHMKTYGNKDNAQKPSN